jgi:tRNA A-37 threonylcarbamoyl transferase component Bud32
MPNRRAVPPIERRFGEESAAVTADLRDRLACVLGGAYAIERELGAGGMSRVFLAEERALGRRVVVKVLPPELAGELSAERFVREIQVAARLQHPHIVPLLNAGEADGLLYYTMPFVEGPSLREKLAAEGELPIADVARILREVTDALAYAHRRGVVHRDIKPENVLLHEAHAVVADFGVAKALTAAAEGGAERGVVTASGVAVGTPAYMAPEQAAADPHVDHRADLYALGALAYEMLTGRPPFAGGSAQQLIAAHLTRTPEPVAASRPSVPPALGALVMRCLEKSPADRPQTAEEVLRELEMVASASGQSLATAAARGPWRRWGASAAVAAALVLAVLTAVAAIVGTRHQAAESALDANRVAVDIFENRTGDPRLEPVGAMAADWITRGIAETGLVDVIDVETQLATQGELAGGLRRSNATNGRPWGRTLAQQAGAHTLIAGSYYLHGRGDSIQFESRIIDAATGRVLQSVPPVSAAVAAPVTGVDLLRRRVMGTLATLFDPGFTAREELAGRPPTYEAYEEFIEGSRAHDRGELGEAVRRYTRAYDLDSTFALAAVNAAADNFYLGRCGQTDSLARVLHDSRARLAPFDGAMLDRQVAKCHGDWPEAYRAAKRMLELSPRSLEARVLAAKGAWENNRPREALELLRTIDPARSALRGWATEYYDIWTGALDAVGDYERELATAERWARDYPGDLYARSATLQPLAALRRGREVQQRLGELLSLPEGSLSDKEQLTLVVARALHVHGDVESARRVARELVLWMNARPFAEAAGEAHRAYMAQALYCAGELREARQVLTRLAREYPDRAAYLGRLGTIAARLGDREEAQRISALLAAWKGTYLNGQPSLHRARIAALLGDRSQATALLRQALSEGLQPTGYRGATAYDDSGLQHDIDLESLHGYRPYDDLLRPKG